MQYILCSTVKLRITPHFTADSPRFTQSESECSTDYDHPKSHSHTGDIVPRFSTPVLLPPQRTHHISLYRPLARPLPRISGFVELCDIVWHCVTSCDIVWYCVTLCDILWHCVTLCDTFVFWTNNRFSVELVKQSMTHDWSTWSINNQTSRLISSFIVTNKRK